MIITTIESVPGKEIKEVYGLVTASTVRSKNIGKDIGAGLKSLAGGEIKAYNEMMEEARNIAIERMIEKAKSMGANAVIGMKIGTSAVMAGASEVIAYGTAVLIDEKLIFHSINDQIIGINKIIINFRFLFTLFSFVK